MEDEARGGHDNPYLMTMATLTPLQRAVYVARFPILSDRGRRIVRSWNYRICVEVDTQRTRSAAWRKRLWRLFQGRLLADDMTTGRDIDKHIPLEFRVFFGGGFWSEKDVEQIKKQDRPPQAINRIRPWGDVA